MDKILTISVAAYNVEQYIGQTLNSLTDEKIINDLEIFVVDDGGTDSTLHIAREYAERFPKSVFPIHKENGGYGTTVNYSIAHASGKYFKTLDGDDWFNQDGLYELVCMLRQADVDVIVTNYCEGIDTGNMEKGQSIGQWSREPIEISALQNIKPIPMFCLTYKTEVLRRSGLQMPGRRFYTDQFYVAVPFIAAKTAQFLDVSVYNYRIGREGQSVSVGFKIRHTDDTLFIAEELSRFYEENKQHPNRNYLCTRVAASVTYAYKALLLHPVSKENLKKIRDYENRIRSISSDVYHKAEKIGKTGKAVTLLRRTGYLAYWLFALLPVQRV